MSPVGYELLLDDPPTLYTYVVALRAEVWDEPRFRAKNRRVADRVARGEAIAAVYIGTSAHRGDARMEIHRGSRSCSCGVQPEGKVPYGMASPWVARFGERVVSETQVDGFSHAAGVRAARALASELRRAGTGGSAT